jgi:ABC-type Fe3+-hydroxamate transport system substrate-binding protein
MRIVSLVPSVTESLLAWGVEPVACTRFCEQPGLLHVGGTKDPDIAAILDLSPDLVVVDREENRRDDAEDLMRRGIRILDLHVTSVRSAIAETERLAQIVGADCGESPVVVDSIVPRVTAFVPIWRRPWMTINSSTYGASLLASIGVLSSHADASSTYPEISVEELSRLREEREVDVVLLPTEPYAFAERHFSEVADATGVGDVRIIDGRDLFWWGVRTVDAQRRLAGVLADLLV